MGRGVVADWWVCPFVVLPVPGLLLLQSMRWAPAWHPSSSRPQGKPPPPTRQRQPPERGGTGAAAAAAGEETPQAAAEREAAPPPTPPMDEVDYEALPTASLAVHLLAGSLAGITEHTVVYPFDAIKTRLQVLRLSTQPSYTGISQAMHVISAREGYRGFWRGVNSVVVGSGPAHALYFAAYEQGKLLLNGAHVAAHEQHPLTHALSGAFATLLHDGLMTPFDVIKQRMQLPDTNYRGLADCAYRVFRSEGLSSFYVSYPTTLMISIPFQAIQLPVYEYLRKTLNPSGDYSPATHVVSGGVAGGLAALATNPLDVAKTLLQTRGTSPIDEVRRAGGILDAWRIILRREGWAGFQRGALARALTQIPATAVSWTTYEFLKMLILTWGTGAPPPPPPPRP